MNILPESYRANPEGQFLERKSCYNKRTRTPRPLPLKNIAAEIAETLAAFANADGGELVIGLDNDGTSSGLPYREKSENAEYPQFAWQEAVVNAIAHRDYGLRGTPVEIHHYDDRLEVVSPGGLVPPITLDILRKGAGGHASRNPLIVRVLVIAGLMREVGEGVPRMFEVMESNGLHKPDFAE